MKNSAKNISLNSYDDIFSTDESRADAAREKVMEIPLAQLYPFENHPFRVVDDAAMQDTAESIKKHGILVPAIARPREAGGYELISGHRRKRGCELAGLTAMPVIVRNLDDDAATIIMVDSNIQRENILPSERAFAYKMKLEAMKRQAGRPSKENTGQLGPNFDNRRSNAILAEQAGESVKQIQRFIRLTELSPELLDMVDSKKVAFNPAVELSYLKSDEQSMYKAFKLTVPSQSVLVPNQAVKQWLGHSDFSTTANIYAHLDYSSKISSAQAMMNGLKLGETSEILSCGALS